MSSEESITLSRQALYLEIWDHSAAAVARKYNIAYGELTARCKEAKIPLPPAGYWTKVSYGKPVSRIPLPTSDQVNVTLHVSLTPKRTRSRKSNANDPKNVSMDSGRSNASPMRPDDAEIKVIPPELPVMANDIRITYKTDTGDIPYVRETLHREVWSKPFVDVAVQYGVSDLTLKKVCKTLQIPCPSREFWAQLREEKKPKEELKTKDPKPIDMQVRAKAVTPPITVFNKPKGKPNAQNQDAFSQSLSFLPEEERARIILAAKELQMPVNDSPIHKKIIAYKTVVSRWNENDRKPQGAQHVYSSYSDPPPFLAGVISPQTLPRVFKLLTVLFQTVETLGGKVNDDLSLQIRNEQVRMDIKENEQQVEHQLTRQEAKELIIYEDAQRHHKYAPKPNIRKYEYVFNGKLTFSVRQRHTFKDTDFEKIESRLGDIFIELYEGSEVVRNDRLAREEAQRKREEEEKQRKARLERYNGEVDRTNALVNAANDMEIARRIRQYIDAIEQHYDTEELDEKSRNSIEWARKKADWFDPAIARRDEVFGVRKHEEPPESKKLEKHWGW